MLLLVASSVGAEPRPPEGSARARICVGSTEHVEDECGIEPVEGSP
ncbi:MAG: hypothetical protein AB1Z98_07580 [Nannocystaceae bacterium]